MSGEPGVLSGEQGPLSGELGALPRDPETLSRDPGSLSRDPGGEGGDPVAEAARQALLETIPGGLAARLGGLGRRSRTEEVRAVVLDLLRLRAWRLDELGTLLRRNPEYLRQNYVQPLVEAGQVAMTRPEVPNDPEQGYRAVGEGA